MTALESLVWFELRGRKLAGFKFRRQAPIGPYIADFYAPAARLVVEIDGPVHDQRLAADEDRTRYLEAKGCQVIRFRADDAALRMDYVLEAILEACRAVHAPRGQELVQMVGPTLPSPHRGEGKN
jgi:adenine-specific DNA-methyltransferase